jgi:hypothetical protein
MALIVKTSRSVSVIFRMGRNHMGNTELFAPVLVTPAYHPQLAVARDADVDLRWAAWIERGRAHDERLRQRLRLMITAGALTIAAAIAFGFFRS